MATNATRRTVYNTFDPNKVDLPGYGGLPGSSGPIVQVPTANVPMATQVSIPPPLPMPGPPASAPPTFGYHGGRAYEHTPQGYNPIGRAQQVNDRTGRFIGGIGRGAVSAIPVIGPALGLGDMLTGGRASRAGGNWISQFLDRQRMKRMNPNTLTRDQITGRQPVTGGAAPLRALPVNIQLIAQQRGVNLGAGMEGTSTDRTITPAAVFGAHQKGNQRWNDTRNPSVGPALPDVPGHIYNGDENGVGARHARTHAELNTPELRKARNASMVATTRQFRDKADGPLTQYRLPQATTPQLIETGDPRLPSYYGDHATVSQGPEQYPAAPRLMVGGTPVSNHLTARLQAIRQRMRERGR